MTPRLAVAVIGAGDAPHEVCALAREVGRSSPGAMPFLFAAAVAG